LVVWGVPLLAGVYFALGVSPPFLAMLGLPQDATAIAGLYGHVCHQIAERSFVICGSKMAFCSRCTGFYGSLFIGSVFIATSRRTRPLRFMALLAFISLGLVDFVFDLSRSVPAANVWRPATGLLAGAGVIWFAFPRLIAAVRR
jgi:uncharacterized membrane protein